MLKTSHGFIEKNENKRKKPCAAILKLLNDQMLKECMEICMT